MSAIRRIIVGVEMPKSRPWTATDIGAPSRLAVEMAFSTAIPARIPVTMVSILPTVTGGWLQSPEEAERRFIADQTAAREILTRLKDEYSPAGGQNQTDVLVRTGDAWEELIRASGNRPDSLVVCGTRDQSSLRRVVFGSTGLKLLRLAPGAVWIVKPGTIANDSTDIVAATDGGPVGADVLQTAVKLARSLNGRLHVVHAVSADLNGPAELQKAEAVIKQQLAETDFRTLPFGVKLMISQGDADQCILKAVQETNADVVVLGTSSKTGVSGLLPGSTVERLLPELSCSVMALKPDGFRSMLPADFWSLQRTPDQR